MGSSGNWSGDRYDISGGVGFGDTVQSTCKFGLSRDLLVLFLGLIELKGENECFSVRPAKISAEKRSSKVVAGYMSMGGMRSAIETSSMRGVLRFYASEGIYVHELSRKRREQ